MNYKLIVSDRAERDVDKHYLWLAKRTSTGGGRWYSKYCVTLESIRVAPERDPIARESRKFAYVIRERLFKTRRGLRYRILFAVIGDEIHVLCVRGPGQRPIRPSDLE